MYILAPLIFVLIPMLEDEPGPQLPVREVVGKHLQGAFVFDWDGLSKDGDPHPLGIVKVVFRFTRPGGEPKHWPIIDRVVVAGKVSVPFAQVLATVGEGDFDVDVKLVDEVGAQGAYSPKMLVTNVVVKKRPSTVNNFRIERP